MKYKKGKLFIFFDVAIGVVMVFLFFSSVSFAQVDTSSNYGLREAAGAAGLSTTATVPETIGQIIRYALQLVGIILVAMIIYGGFMIMTASGSKDQIEKAYAIIKNAIVGLLIITASYVIANFLITRLATTVG